MHCSYDEDVLPCPERVVAEVVASAALDGELGLPDPGPLQWPWHADVAAIEADRAEDDPQRDATPSIGGDVRRIDAWARHSLASNGFGG